MRTISLALMGAAALALAPLPAFAHHKTGHRDFFSHTERTETPRTHGNPCGGVSNSPHEPGARQAQQQRCRQLRAQLNERPDDAGLRAECDRLAHGLTGRPC
jgi:hypothetical protein